MLLVVSQLSRDVISYEGSWCHWCVSIRLLSQLNNRLLDWKSKNHVLGFYKVLQIKAATLRLENLSDNSFDF